MDRSHRVTLGVLSGVLVAVCALRSTAAPAPAEGGQTALRFETPDKKYTYNYLLYLPKGYADKGDKKWPLIVFLHGIAERGTNIDMVKNHGVPKIVGQKDDFPFVVLSPQCELNSVWGAEVVGLNALLDDVLAKRAVDPDRVCLTGHSMGGYGTWAWACANPERFAALAPICGAGDPTKAVAIKDIPTWVFHGAKDTVDRPAKSEAMVNAMKAAGGDPKYTLYPDAFHDSWTVTYDNPELYKWFLSQTRKKAGAAK
jgi:predicted peptidase